MGRLVAVIALGLVLAGPLSAGAQTRPDPHKTEAHAPAKTESHGASAFNRNLALLGGGLLGVVLASGAINIAMAGSMMYQGVAVAEALEGGAGLTMPIALLAGALGALFGQEPVLALLAPAEAGDHPKPAH